MQREPADWAIERACALFNEARHTGPWDSRLNRGNPVVVTFARYIEAHEEPPVDPLWAEAMAFTAGRGWNGSSPALPMVKFAYAALRRGIELGKEQL
jgi:hypothetical protein